MSVTRYDVNGPSSVFEDVNGSLVDYKDYAALEAKCAALAAELSAIEAIHNDAVFITDDQYEQCPPQVQKMIRSLAVLQIPAYQSFLAEVRASALPENIAEIIDSGDLETICWQHEHYKAEDYRLSLYRFRTDRAALLQGNQAPVKQPSSNGVIGWLRSDYNSDDKRDPNAPLFMLGSNDPSEAWGVKYIPLSGNSPVIPDGWVMVPVDMTPEQMRAVQIKSELGSYAAANLSGAYALFREFWDVSVAAAPQQEAE